MMDFPSSRVSEQGPDWFFVATEACSERTPDLDFVLEVWGYIRGVGVGNKSGGSPSQPQDSGCTQGVGRALLSCGWLRTLQAQLRYSMGFFWSKNNLRQFSGQLDSVWFSFSAILKNKEKTKTGIGL